MIMAMRLAQVSDAHLLSLAGRPSLKDIMVSVGRPLDPAMRYRRLLDALRLAADHATHVVLSGDLAETGSVGQYEALASALEAAGLGADRITMLPGNHDRYDTDDAWERALRGPLAPWAPSAAHSGQHVVRQLSGARLVAVDATRPQNVLRSAGQLTAAHLATIAAEAHAAEAAREHLVLALHHPPQVSAFGLWHAMNGLLGAEQLVAMMGSWAPMSLLHGHVHVERMLTVGRHRSYSAAATVCDGARSAAFYELGDGTLRRVHGSRLGEALATAP